MVPMEKNTDKYTHSTQAAPASAQSPGTSNKGKLSYSWVTRNHLLENLMSHYMNKGNIHKYNSWLYSSHGEKNQMKKLLDKTLRTHLSITLLFLIFNYSNPPIF